MYNLLSYRQAHILHWTCLLVLLVLIVTIPRGCTSSKIEATSGINGNPSIELTPEKPLAEKSKVSVSQRYAPPEIYAEGFTKNDWFFVVFYNYTVRADLSIAPALEGTSIGLTINMPGQITHANAQRINEGHAAWNLKLGRNYKMDVSSRYVRWWLITLTVILLVLWIYSWFVLRASKRVGNRESSYRQSTDVKAERD